MNADNELLKNLDKLHTTELGVERIKRNLSLDTDDVVDWCKAKINSVNAVITRSGKNWYVNIHQFTTFYTSLQLFTKIKNTNPSFHSII